MIKNKIKIVKKQMVVPFILGLLYSWVHKLLFKIFIGSRLKNLHLNISFPNPLSKEQGGV